MLTAQQSGSVTSFDVSRLHTNSVKQGQQQQQQQQHNPAVAAGGGMGAAANANANQSAAQLVAAVGLAATASSMSNYKIVNTIGRGNFGVCHLCECLDTKNPAHLGKMFVIKQINMSQLSASEKEGAVQEVKLLSELHHPFIVGYKESFLEGEILNIVMTYCEGGDLTTLIKQQEGKYFPEEQILDWFIQLCLSLRYIHQRRIIHRDLKSQNIFLTKRFNVRLGDFGIARVLNGTNELAMSVVGTPYSMSPEVCENKPYSFKSDIWALGCVLYELCTLKHAFDAHNLLGLVWKIVSESYPPIPSHYTPELTDLVGKMLSKDPAGRPSIDAILEMPFIRARLHSQIRAKMNLKNKQAAAQAAGKQKATTAAAGATQNGQPPAATKPRSQSSATPSSLPSSLGVASRSNSTSAATPTTPNGGAANNAGPTGTLRSNATRPTLDVDRANGALPPSGGVERLTSPSSHNLPHQPSALSSQNRASSAIAANRSANAATPSYNLNHSSANFSSSPQSVHSARSANDGAPMLSPSDRLSMRKKAEADARARELAEAARAAAGDRMYAAQRTNAEFRGGAGPRPTSGLPSSSSHNTPSYASAFEDDMPSSSSSAIPPRQRSAGNSRPDSYEGRTPTRSTVMDYPAAFNSTVTATSNLSLDDRPIKSSGAYRLGAGTKAMSPAAIQAQRTTGGGGGTTPPSGGSSNSSYNVRTTARLGDDDDSALGSSRARPSSVSSSGSSRVTRVHDDDEGEESYSGDDFDPLSEEEEEILHEFERTYTLPQQRSAGAAGDRPISSTPSSAANRGVGSKHIPSSLASPTASNSAYSSSTIMSSNSGSTATTTNSEPPSISDKRAAIKEKCLRKMSDSEFTEVYSFIKQRQREAESAKDGSKDITADELTNKFGERNKDVLFLIEQYVFLSSILDRNSANSNGGSGASSSSSANGASADVRKRSSSGASVISPLKSASTSGTPARSPTAKPVGSPPSASKPTSATSRMKK